MNIQGHAALVTGGGSGLGEATARELARQGATVIGTATSEDGAGSVAVGFRARKADGTFKYFWLYRVKFAVPAMSLATKGDSITFSTPTIEGTILRRNKPDATGAHPWKAEVSEGEAGSGAVVSTWYDAVYEPTYTAGAQGEGK